jgi:integrase
MGCFDSIWNSGWLWLEPSTGKARTMTTPPKKKAKELAKLFRAERPDYPYLKSVFRALREELEIVVPRKEERLPEVPTEGEMLRFYQAVWNCRNFADIVLIKTLFYTGVRVSELVSLRLDEVDVERCQMRITQGKGSKDRQAPFPLRLYDTFSSIMFILFMPATLPLVTAYVALPPIKLKDMRPDTLIILI